MCVVLPQNGSRRTGGGVGVGLSCGVCIEIKVKINKEKSCFHANLFIK